MRTVPAVTVRTVLLALTVGMASGCTDSPTRVTPSDPTTIRSQVVGQAQLALGSDGLFSQAALGSNAGPSEIPLGRARELAISFVKTFGPQFLRMMQNDHQGPIDLSALKPCGRVFLAVTPYEPLAPETPQWVQRAHGSWWLVSFCGAQQDRQVSVAVSALATRMEVDQSGRLVYPPDDQSELFLVLGIPRALRELPPEPENAAVAAAVASGKRVSAVPRFIAPPLGNFPQLGHWENVLDGAANLPVNSHGVTASRSASTIYHGIETFADPPYSYATSQSQPATTDFVYPVGKPGPDEKKVVVTVKRRADMPLSFDKIVGRR